MIAKRNISTAIADLKTDGSINIKNKSKQTVKNWAKTINDELANKNCSWRVVYSMNNEGGIISAIPLERYEAIVNLL